MKKDNIPRCDACGICCGENFLTKSLTPVGPSQLCDDCYKTLKSKGFLYLADYLIDGKKAIEIMKEDGEKSLIFDIDEIDLELIQKGGEVLEATKLCNHEFVECPECHSVFCPRCYKIWKEKPSDIFPDTATATVTTPLFTYTGDVPKEDVLRIYYHVPETTVSDWSYSFYNYL